MTTPKQSTHAGGPGNFLAVFATPQEIGLVTAPFMPCAGIAGDGSNVTHAAVVLFTDDGFFHMAGDLADAIADDPLAMEYIRTLPAVARVMGSLPSLPGYDVATLDSPRIVPAKLYTGRHRSPGRIMRALGFRQ